MGNTKKRLAVFLSILFILPSILAVLPQTSEEVQAGPRGRITMVALEGLSTSYSDAELRILMVEADQQFHIGDYMKLWFANGYVVGTVSSQKASYSSSNNSVATVNSKGLVSTKTEGTTNIKLKCKGATRTFELRVMKKGSFGEKESYTKVRNALAELMKNMPSKVTSKNAFQMIKKIKAYQAACNQVSISTSGAEGSGRLVVPQAGRFNMYQQMLWVV